MVSPAYFTNIFLMFVRILAVFMTAPIFSSRNIPNMAKIGFAGILAFLLFPLSKFDETLSVTAMDLGPFILSVIQEVLVGSLIGFASNLVFVAVGMGAGMMGMQVGFRAASLFNPVFNMSSAALDQFYAFLVAALFLAVNGHHMLILALGHTFQTIPLGSFIFDALTTERLVSMTSQAFVAAVQIALPVVGVLLLTDIGLGLVARAVPQVQVFFLSLPLKIGLGILALALTLSVTLPMIRDYFDDIVNNIVVFGMR